MSSEQDPSANPALEQRLQEASLLADEGHWEEAFVILLEEEQEHPEDAVLLCMLGVAARAVDADGPAYEYFRRCLAQSPTDPVLLTTAGSPLASLGELEGESALRLAALTAPDLPLARLHYGAYLAREGMLDVAVAELEAARSLDEGDSSIRLELAIAYLLAGRTDAGVAEMEEALSRSSDDPWIRFLYGLALLETERIEQAAEELHRAAAERVDDTDAQLVSALASAIQGWTDEAWNAFARAEATDAADPGLLEEVEASIEAGAGAAETLLASYLAPSVLRTRLMTRP
jgi:Flp pilus assembly protein TadD